ncbi:LacI family DNA-binding transcriptional regulator [Hyphomicrobiales bacterium]|uniref:LacI family DNA-binding transcriptional regulator n=1 Tax=Rhizobium sp. TaxID=391 RepID=UPI000DDF13AF
MSKSRTPSIKMVADRAGVSVATVSNVLNGKPTVSPDFARRVNDAVRELGYVVDLGASRLRSRKAQLAGVVVPDLTNPMFASFVSTLEHLARLDDYDLVVVSARNNVEEEADRLRKIRSWRPAGLIVIPCDGAFAERLPNGFFAPVVLADRIPDAAGFDLIAVDNGPAAGAIAAHLDRQGYGDCLVLGSSLSITNVRERWEGVRAAAGRMHVEMLEIGIDDANGAQRLEERLRQRPLPGALFSLDHGTTLLTYRTMAEIGLSVPGDLAFASFDDMEWMQLVAPGITAVRQPIEEMAEQAWALLLRRMTGSAGKPVTRRLRCAVEIRGSTPRSPLEEAGNTKLGGEKWKLQDEPYSPE